MKKEIRYVVTYLEQPVYYETINFNCEDSRIEIIATRKDDTEKERIILDEGSKKVLFYQKEVNGNPFFSLKCISEKEYLYGKELEGRMISEGNFMFPILFQSLDSFEQSEELIVKNVLLFEDKPTLVPYDYYCFSNKVNIIKPGGVFLEYASDGQLAIMKEYDTRCAKKRL